MVTSYSDADSVTAAAVVVSMETDLYIYTHHGGLARWVGVGLEYSCIG